MKLSLCMIVKNEETQIIPCLERAMEVVDEAVIVDTGSTDATKALIQERFGTDPRVKIFDYVWENDFGKARGESLKHATGDWILVLDADERLFADRRGIEAFVENRDDNAYIVTIYNVLDAENMSKAATMVRLYRREGATYSGAIHEQVDHFGKRVHSHTIDEAICRIYHYGYMPQVIHEKGKSKRNIDIIKEEIENDPDSAFNWYNLGVMDMNREAYDEAIDNFLKSHRLCNNVRYVFHEDLVLRIAMCMLLLKQHKQLIKLVDSIMDDPILGRKPDFYYYQGVAYGEMKKYARAVNAFRKAVSLGEYSSSVSKYGSGSFLPKIKWAELLIEQGMIEEGIEKYWDAIQDEYNVNLVGMEALKGLLEQRGRAEELERLRTIHSPDKASKEDPPDTGILDYAAQVKRKIRELIEVNDLSNARSIIMEYEKIIPDDIEMLSIKGVMAMIGQEYALAESLFSQGLSREPDNFDLLYNIGFLYYHTQNWSKARHYLDRAQQTAPDEALRGELSRMVNTIPEE